MTISENQKFHPTKFCIEISSKIVPRNIAFLSNFIRITGCREGIRSKYAAPRMNQLRQLVKHGLVILIVYLDRFQGQHTCSKYHIFICEQIITITQFQRHFFEGRSRNMYQKFCRNEQIQNCVSTLYNRFILRGSLLNIQYLDMKMKYFKVSYTIFF